MKEKCEAMLDFDKVLRDNECQLLGPNGRRDEWCGLCDNCEWLGYHYTVDDLL